MIFGRQFLFQIYPQLYLKGFFCRIYNRIRKLNFGFGSETRFTSLLEFNCSCSFSKFIYKH